jgi:hypothetical protein
MTERVNINNTRILINFWPGFTLAHYIIRNNVKQHPHLAIHVHEGFNIRTWFHILIFFFVLVAANIFHKQATQKPLTARDLAFFFDTQET